MNYIGSKLKLCQNFLPNTIKSVCGEDLSQKTFCDIFAGTGIVGRTFKTSVKKVISNDIEYYSYVLNKNYIENHRDIPNKDELLKFSYDNFKFHPNFKIIKINQNYKIIKNTIFWNFLRYIKMLFSKS